MALIHDPSWGWRSQEFLDSHRGVYEPVYRTSEEAKDSNPFMDDGVYDEIYDSEDDAYVYDYDFNRQMKFDYERTGKKEDESKFWDKEWGDYERSGVWKGYGYYRKSTVDYRYIDQMANALSAQHDVEVKQGSEWSVDLEKKTLTFNPTDLMFGTKGEVMGTLLHEVGTVRYVTPTKDLKGAFLGLYKEPAEEALNVYEDRRTDEIMAESLPSARELMLNNKKLYQKKVEDYLKAHQVLKNLLRSTFEREVGNLLKVVPNEAEVKRLAVSCGMEPEKTAESLVDPKMIRLFSQAREKLSKFDTVFVYLAAILAESLGLPKVPVSKEVGAMVKATLPVFAEDTVKAADSQANLNLLEGRVYPVIEPLLKNFVKPPVPELDEMFGDAYGESLMRVVTNAMTTNPLHEVHGAGLRHSAMAWRAGGKEYVPQEWADGNYDALKESVGSSIKELTRKLKNLRAVEQTRKWTPGHRKGKLNTKELYKHATGNSRLFKRPEELRDTLQSFAFSFMFDRSGSMQGPKVIHSVRGMVILMEVFQALGIPFEVMAFGDKPVHLKKFGDKFDKKRKVKIAGIVTQCNTGTTLANSLQAIELAERPERNKTLIVLSDGDLYDVDDSKAELKELYGSGVKVLAYALACPVNSVAQVFGGERSEGVADALQLPEVFNRMFRQVLKEKGGVKL